MSYYFGCATNMNKLKWAAFILFIVLGLIFLILYEVLVVKSTKEYNKCIDQWITVDWRVYFEQEFDDKFNRWDCQAEYKAHSTQKTIYFIFTILCFMVASIILLLMAYCSPPPSDNSNDQFPLLGMQNQQQ
eukprot:TRINITY_DN8729_c1_g2_i2.p2 TRINITY_DN8729_c1_g2~~TRINITY_DN8729_c1_g2_i2.p2  ORF type:complete len:131 (-),score=1.12 TRINITY_DN8729_c1_g2_i2:523-915(-)